MICCEEGKKLVNEKKKSVRYKRHIYYKKYININVGIFQDKMDQNYKSNKIRLNKYVTKQFVYDFNQCQSYANISSIFTESQ